jgi:hypothetical protein
VARIAVRRRRRGVEATAREKDGCRRRREELGGQTCGTKEKERR